MQTWILADAKDRFVEILHACVQEPQIVYEQSKPLGVVLGMDFFTNLMSPPAPQIRLSIAELLRELREIQKTETAEIEIPIRQDRPNAMLE